MNKRLQKLCSLFIIGALLFSAISLPISSLGGTMMYITDLEVNGLSNPLGIDTNPVFSWVNFMEGYGKSQTAYQIIVADNAEDATAHSGNLWDSGKTDGTQNYDIVYAGTPLTERTAYWWAVRVWDEAGNSAWSDIACFETGIFCNDNWNAQWITYSAEQSATVSAPMFRKTFTIQKEVKRARVYISGLGMYEMHINGELPDDTVLNPAHTQYTETVLYRAYDVTDMLIQGNNAIAVELGNGWYNCDISNWNWNVAPWRDTPKLLFELTMEYADGTTETVASDTSWKVCLSGPTVYNNIYLGEHYDARLEIDDWTTPNFDDSAFLNAVLADAPTGTLTFECMEPMRKLAAFTPSVRNCGCGKFLITIDEMTTGWAKIAFNAPAGTEITIHYCEKLDSSGNPVFPTYSSLNLQIDKYICKGEKNEIYEPKFVYNGYQYILIENYPGTLTAEDVTCYFIANDTKIISEFETGNQTINFMHEMVRRTMQNNFQGKPTDTPVYEKNGWAGDYNVSLEMMNFNFDMSAFNAKFLNDMRDRQTETGLIPVITPGNWNWGNDNAVVWNSAYINGVYEAWRTGGEMSLIKEHYDAMRLQAQSYINILQKNGWVWLNGQLSDWVSPNGGSSPAEGSGIAGSGYAYFALGRIAEMADALGKSEDAAEYREAMGKLYTAFNETYYDTENGWYDTGYWNANNAGTRSKYRQTSNLVALAFGLCPEEYKEAVVKNLINDITVNKDMHLDTGIVGTKLILTSLSELGYGELALDLVFQDTYPSWGYWIANGANSCWESWYATARSHNHYFLGTYEDWFFKNLAGIRDMTNGYETVTLKPEVYGKLGYVSCTLQTVRGTLESRWAFTEDNKLMWSTVIPVGTTATVYLPANGAVVNGNALTAQAGVSVNNDGTLTLLSGSYTFLMDASGFEVDTSLLTETIHSAEALVKEDYLASAWPAFESELNKAKTVLADATATQFAVHTATAALQNAMDAVKQNYNAPLKTLKSYIACAQTLNNTDYPNSRYDAFSIVLQSAIAIAADSDATQQQIENACAALTEATKLLGDYCHGNIALGKTVSVSSDVANASWSKEKLTDGDLTHTSTSGENCGWSSNTNLQSNHTEWVIVDLGAMYKFNRVSLMPTGCKNTMQLCEGFPRDFTIDISEDGLTWTTVYEATDYTTPKAVMQTFTFDTVFARYVRVYATALKPRTIDKGYYRMQLAEIEVELKSPTVDYDTDFNGKIDMLDALNMLKTVLRGDKSQSLRNVHDVLNYLSKS